MRAAVVSAAALVVAMLSVACVPLVSQSNPTPERRRFDPQVVAAVTVVRVEGQGCGLVVSGSGVDLGDGRLVTNRHVVEGMASVRLVWPDVSAAAVRPASSEAAPSASGTVVAASADRDLALVSFDRPSELVSAPADVPPAGSARLGADPFEGEQVLAAGFEAGGPLRTVSGPVLGPVRATVAGTGTDAGDVFKVDVAVDHGDSGGAVLSGDGYLDGVVFAKDLVSGDAMVVGAADVARFLSSVPPVSARRMAADMGPGVPPVVSCPTGR